MSETDLRTELTLLGETMEARFARMEAIVQGGFARMDHHIEATHRGFARLDDHIEATHRGFARLDHHIEATHGGFARLDHHIEATHGSFARVDETMQAGFARVDHYFELQQAQHLELRADVQELTRRMDRVEERLDSLQGTVGALRDWAAREFADVRREIRRLRHEIVERDDALHGDVDDLSERVTRLEQRLAEE
jgi:chromosome segregation ATPase